jgi:predicted kinase
VAEDNVVLGRTVIADSVNPWPITRAAWRDVAIRAGVRYVEIEVICSDAMEHRRRVEVRVPELNGPTLTWQDVVARDYRPWDGDRIVLDTSVDSVDRTVQRLRAFLAESP